MAAPRHPLGKRIPTDHAQRPWSHQRTPVPIAPWIPAQVFRLGRLARQRPIVASCHVAAEAIAARPGAARPGSPQEGPARRRRDRREFWRRGAREVPVDPPGRASRRGTHAAAERSGGGPGDGSQTARQCHHHPANPRLYPEKPGQQRRPGPRVRDPQPHRGALEGAPRDRRSILLPARTAWPPP